LDDDCNAELGAALDKPGQRHSLALGLATVILGLRLVAPSVPVEGGGLGYCSLDLIRHV
jgi:hypothetical protein